MKEEIEKVEIKLETKHEPQKIIYELLEDIAEERLNRAFDILFEETLKMIEVDKLRLTPSDN